MVLSQKHRNWQRQKGRGRRNQKFLGTYITRRTSFISPLRKPFVNCCEAGVIQRCEGRPCAPFIQVVLISGWVPRSLRGYEPWSLHLQLSGLDRPTGTYLKVRCEKHKKGASVGGAEVTQRGTGGIWGLWDGSKCM